MIGYLGFGPLLRAACIIFLDLMNPTYSQIVNECHNYNEVKCNGKINYLSFEMGQKTI